MHGCFATRTMFLLGDGIKKRGSDSCGACYTHKLVHHHHHHHFIIISRCIPFLSRSSLDRKRADLEHRSCTVIVHATTRQCTEKKRASWKYESIEKASMNAPTLCCCCCPSSAFFLDPVFSLASRDYTRLNSARIGATDTTSS